MGESEFLKAELDDLRRVREDTEKEQRSLTEIESKALFILHRHIIYSVNESNFWSWSSDIAASPAVCVCLSVCVHATSTRKSSGQRAALHQAEGEVHRAGSEPRRPAEKGETLYFMRSLDRSGLLVSFISVKLRICCLNYKCFFVCLYAERRGDPADDGSSGGTG